ncbi:MAG TPA: hypothetical protein VK070_07535 [Acidimicrobiia bacterium]|nr:hypothetical protein [Acidimicrobiia bacterium]
MRRIAIACSLLVAACSSGGTTIPPDTPPDLVELVERTLEEIGAALPAHAACLDDLTVTHAWELDDRAEYRVADRTVVLRVPATAPELEFSLAHEVAHHLDFGCGLEPDVRDAFAAAQGTDEPWEQGEAWESTPAELFATAVATLVTGHSDPLRHIAIEEAAMEVVRKWADGSAVVLADSPDAAG